MSVRGIVSNFLGPLPKGKISQDIRSKTSLRVFVGTVRNRDPCIPSSKAYAMKKVQIRS